MSFAKANIAIAFVFSKFGPWTRRYVSFLGVSNKLSTSVGMEGALHFVMTIAKLETYLLHQFVLVPTGLDYLRTITFILVIASLMQMVEIILEKVSPALYQVLGVFLPLITTNCALLGVAILALGLEW